MLTRLVLCVSIVHLLYAIDGGASPAAVPVFQPRVCSMAPLVNGRLDDPCWAQASRADQFFDADTGKAAPESTKVFICYDREALYVAFVCSDREPHRIKAVQKKRGGMIWEDDLVEIGLDTYHAHEETYWFSLTAGGTQHDHFPGGSCANIGWRGDWYGAVEIRENGWTAELAIPWSILRFPEDATTMGISASRHIPRRDLWLSWPFMGSDWDASLMADLVGLQLPQVGSRPVILPYLFGVSKQGAGSELSFGLDVKQLFRSGLTGTVTYNPDFRTIEDEIESIDFSYTERYVADRRPFFTEGADYFPGSRMFYTRRIEDVDTGVKLFGRLGRSEIGILDAVDFGERNDFAGKVAFDAAQDVKLWVGGAHSAMPDSSSAAAGFGVNYDHTMTGGGGVSSSFTVNRSLVRSVKGNALSANVGKWPGGKGGFNFWSSIQRIDDAYGSWTSFLPETNLWKVGIYPGYWRRFDDTAIRGVDGGISLYRAMSLADTLLYRGLDVHAGVDFRALNDSGIWARVSQVERPPNVDRTARLGLFWNDKDIHQWGNVGVSLGSKDGERYLFLEMEQGYSLTEDVHFKLRGEFRRMQEPDLGAEYQNLMVLTGNYDLTSEQSIGLLLIHRRNPGDADDLTDHRALNLCLTYHQSVRSGTDVFLILGDPNEEEIQKRVAMQLVRPFGN